MIRLSTGAAFGVAVAAAVATPLASASAAQQAATPSADTRPAVAAEQAQADHQRQAMGLSGDEKLIVRDVVIDADGTRHVRYDRTYKGLRVLGGDFVARKDAAGSDQARVLERQRRRGGDVHVPRSWPRPRQSSRRHGAPATRPRGNDGELVVWAGRGHAQARVGRRHRRRQGRPDAEPPAHHRRRGQRRRHQLRRGQERHRQLACTPATVTLNTISVRLDLAAQATRSATTRPTSTARPAARAPSSRDADNVWGNGSTSNRQTAGVDAQYGAEKTFDYYKNVHGRNGIWNNGTGARSRVHYGNAYVNAFWDGTPDDLRRRRRQRQAAHLASTSRPTR